MQKEPEFPLDLDSRNLEPLKAGQNKALNLQIQAKSSSPNPKPTKIRSRPINQARIQAQAQEAMPLGHEETIVSSKSRSALRRGDRLFGSHLRAALNAAWKWLTKGGPTPQPPAPEPKIRPF